MICLVARLTLVALVALVPPLAATPRSGGHDATMTENAAGGAVVEVTTENIQVTCIFEDDKLFLRRVAYVETKDGKDDGTFRQAYHGGLWKVDENMFKKTQELATLSKLQKYISSIKTTFNISWAKQVWQDCRKPMVSALATKLYILSKTSASVPRDIPGQASFWKTHYRTNGNTTVFIDDSNELNEACPAKVDIVFVVDGSGSVGSINFGKTKEFVYKVVESFNVGSNNTRVSLVKYDSRVFTEFYLQNSFMDNKDGMLQAINNMKYPGGGTKTYDAIDHIVNSVFTTNNGARNRTEVPRVAIVMTDGQSILNRVETAAKKAHAAKITMFAVGIGSNINHKELDAIASVPKCLHLFELSGFNEVESLKYAIEKGSCDAPIIAEPGKDGSEIDNKLPPGGDKNCKIILPSNGATVKVNPKTGSASFFVAKNTYPSEAYYDDMVDARPGFPGVLFLDKTEGQADGTIFCNIKGNETEESEINTGIDPGDTNRCKHTECKQGSTCVDIGDKYRCECTTDYVGEHCDEDRSYDCLSNSPCTPSNRARERYFFKHHDSSKFVQCDHVGTCHVMSCPPGLDWSVKENACSLP